MTELRQALNDINAIRTQVARGTQFRGYGPGSVALSGVLAMAVAAAQAHWVQHSQHDTRLFLAHLGIDGCDRRDPRVVGNYLSGAAGAFGARY